MQSKSSRNPPCVPLSVAENKATHVKLRNSARPGRMGSYPEAVSGIIPRVHTGLRKIPVPISLNEKVSLN